MEEELRFINASTDRFSYVSPILTSTHLNKVILYAPNEMAFNYYTTFSNRLNYMVPINFKKGIISKEVISHMILMSINRDNNFSTDNILTHLYKHSKLFHNCKIYTNAVSIPKIIIDPVKIQGYDEIRRKYKLPKYNFMKWIDVWCKKQTLGSSVYLHDGGYNAKVKSYLIGAGYEEKSYNVFKKISNPLKAKFIYI